jgi:hypothetical protein
MLWVFFHDVFLGPKMSVFKMLNVHTFFELTRDFMPTYDE